jgi:RNA polymerase sigma-70 factor (ECF subfamily)
MLDHAPDGMERDGPRRMTGEGAAGGDGRLAAFRQHRPLLLSIAYRMIGSWADAEDVVQETFVRWQQTAEEIASPRAFLVTVASRLCINHLESARVRREEYVGQWLPEPVMTGAGDPDAMVQMDESLSMAFLMLLERLTPPERAVFLLREVFEYEYEDIATIVGQSATTCRQILRRARQHVVDVRRRFTPSPQQREGLVRRFVEASAGGDIRGLVTLLAEDVVVYADGGGKAAALPKPVRGGWRVARLLVSALRKFVPPRAERRIVPINGAPGVVTYLDGRPISVLGFDVDDRRIAAVYIVTNPDKLSRLPLLVTAAS